MGNPLNDWFRLDVDEFIHDICQTHNDMELYNAMVTGGKNPLTRAETRRLTAIVDEMEAADTDANAPVFDKYFVNGDFEEGLKKDTDLYALLEKIKQPGRQSQPRMKTTIHSRRHKSSRGQSSLGTTR